MKWDRVQQFLNNPAGPIVQWQDTALALLRREFDSPWVHKVRLGPSCIVFVSQAFCVTNGFDFLRQRCYAGLSTYMGVKHMKRSRRNEGFSNEVKKPKRFSRKVRKSEKAARKESKTIIRTTESQKPLNVDDFPEMRGIEIHVEECPSCNSGRIHHGRCSICGTRIHGRGVYR